MKFRCLTKDEIECRVAMVKDSGLQLLLYKNARTDADILDETVGEENWQCRYYECKGNLFCSVGIRIGDEWIWKDDCGAESNMEKEKGEASDSFKRACFRWGIGRTELYNTPFIWIPKNKCNIIDNKKCYDKFSVGKIAFDENKHPVGISIWNTTRDERCFVWQAN